MGSQVGDAMPPQRSFADVEFEGAKRQTRQARFLQQLDALIPWPQLEQRIRPVYPTGDRGRPPYPLAVMLRIHCVQLCYSLSDPAMHQVKEEQQWYFGMRAHIGVDAHTGLVHSVATTANVADITQVPRLLHGGETQVWGDAGYLGVARHSGSVSTTSVGRTTRGS